MDRRVKARPIGHVQDGYKREALKEIALSWNDAGSILVAGLLQVRPKGATKVAPALFYSPITIVNSDFLI